MFDKLKNAASNVGDLGNASDLRKYVEGIDFPASKDEIIAQLRASGAQEDLVNKIREIGQAQFQSQSDLLTSFMNKR